MALLEYVKSKPASARALPLVHVMPSTLFEQMARSGLPHLLPTDCKVFNERRLYFFYGRVAYRVSTERWMPRNLALPVVLVTRPNAGIDPLAVFPFDTGAHHAGRYDGVIGKGLAMTSFELEPELSSAQRATSAFFGSNRNYWRGKPRRRLGAAPSNDEARLYHKLISTDNGCYDDRCASMEIQYRHKFSLNKSDMIGVIAPENYRRHRESAPFIGNIVDTANLRFYEQDWLTSPNEYLMLTRKMSCELLRERGYDI